MSSPSSSYYRDTDGTATGPASSTAAAPPNNNSSSSNNDGSDTTTNDTTATAEEMTAEELSRRMFLGGLLGLPWLWIAHTLYFRGKERANNDSDSGEQVEITQVERMWVQRCRNSAIFVSSAWVVWVLLVQVFLSEYFPDSLFVAQDNTGEATGW